MRRYLAAAVVSLAALTACGQPQTSEVVSAGGAVPSAASSQESSEEDGLKFAQCMREHGIDMADPEPGGGGSVMIRRKADAERLEEAGKACGKYSPFGPESTYSNDPEIQDAFLALARCMRGHGVDMPDPDFSGGSVRFSGNGVDPDSPKTEKALEACRDHLPSPGNLP
ncbi:hypothetical protein GCM10010517_17230 [Streptosporangium fragile]|uniref:Lipoprotein n=1 Tax=Streptosporangium fragile TaxID=46186 RepID=A0ABN3VTP3_9ACTN